MARNKTIDWLINPDGTPGQTHNIVKGCNGPAGDGKHCSYCYAVQTVKRWDYAERVARKEAEWNCYNDSAEAVNEMAGRVQDKILSFEPYFFNYVFEQKLRKKPTMYFFSMSDPVDWKEEWCKKIIKKIKEYSQHTFVILMKRPKIYEKYVFPENCWLGVTVTNNGEWNKIACITESFLENMTFISFEPLYEELKDSTINHINTGDWFHYRDDYGEECYHHGKKVDWVIVGPERGKIVDREILFPFFTLDVPVFMKESCKPSLYRGEALRQDWPEGYLEGVKNERN